MVVPTDQPGSSFLLAVAHTDDPAMLRTVRAAKHRAVAFKAMANDSTLAMFAAGRQGVNRTFEAVESVRFSLHNYFKRFVVIVSADFTCSHKAPVIAKFNRRVLLRRRREYLSRSDWRPSMVAASC
jgi:hypothetical protein